MKHKKPPYSLLFALTAFATTAFADPSQHDILLVDQQGQETRIGQLTLTPTKEHMHEVKVSMDNSKFTDHFLSMRPFKCITGEAYQLCHLPYPYENKRIVSADELTDLEYDLLFIRRSPTDYGINPWFGVYYKMAWNDQGTIPETGTLHEVNLDLLASPPEAGNFRPIPEYELHEADASQHHWPQIKIR